MVVDVRHPKGEGTYGDPRDVAIPEPLRSYVLRYLRARVKMLADKGMLFANPFFAARAIPSPSTAQTRSDA
jgi:hypothetical protein